ncbi:unnamed protein product [Symbiodinium sp. CCMP2456]|nr:unnamed protein product [Symbiodinium sp. CCMP2456]
MAMTPRRVLLLLCTTGMCLAASCRADGEACDSEDQALLQHDSNPRFNILQVSQTTVRKAKRCANEYFTKLASANLSSDYRPWRYRRMPASGRNMVIGAGMGTTGTHSVVVALEELGLKGYHFKDARASANEHAKEHGLPDYVVPIVEQLKQNTTACYGAIETFDFSTLPDNVEYVSDTPFTELFLDIYTQFPTAKVVLTTRPSLDWAKSRKKHANSPPPVLRPCGLAGVKDYAETDLAAMLDSYNDLVRCVVPPGNLLEVDLFQNGTNLTETLASFLDNRLEGRVEHSRAVNVKRHFLPNCQLASRMLCDSFIVPEKCEGNILDYINK